VYLGDTKLDIKGLFGDKLELWKNEAESKFDSTELCRSIKSIKHSIEGDHKGVDNGSIVVS
jgi:hypothetical protein